MKSIATDYGAGADRARFKDEASSAAKTIAVVAGPTGSGKSALAIDLARAFDGVVVNADSMQVYRELRILTARPTAADEARAPHRLFGILSVRERCSAGRWLRLALPEIERAFEAGRVPVVVGGTGLYLKALMEGLAAVPEIPEAVVEEARRLHRDVGGAAFREALRALDPGAGERLPASDTQRLIRAYAVARATGRPLADWQRAPGIGPAVAARFTVVALAPPREALYPALDTRFDAMLAAGGLDEARAFAALGIDPTLPAAKAVGVKQLLGHLAGAWDFATAVTKAKQATRNFAKRQATWLRHQLEADLTLEGVYGPDRWPEVQRFAAGRLDRRR